MKSFLGMKRASIIEGLKAGVKVEAALRRKGAGMEEYFVD
jgi:hypothetical protein